MDERTKDSVSPDEMIFIEECQKVFSEASRKLGSLFEEYIGKSHIFLERNLRKGIQGSFGNAIEDKELDLDLSKISDLEPWDPARDEKFRRILNEQLNSANPETRWLAKTIRLMV